MISFILIAITFFIQIAWIVGITHVKQVQLLVQTVVLNLLHFTSTKLMILGLLKQILLFQTGHKLNASWLTALVKSSEVMKRFRTQEIMILQKYSLYYKGQKYTKCYHQFLVKNIRDEIRVFHNRAVRHLFLINDWKVVFLVCSETCPF